MKDQAVVDAYYDAVVAPANPDSPALVNYIRLTGVVPTKVARSIRGGLASDEPQQVVNAASLMRELGKHDDALVKGFGAQRLKFANAVMDGVDGSLVAKRAIDLADKSHRVTHRTRRESHRVIGRRPRGRLQFIGAYP